MFNCLKTMHCMAYLRNLASTFTMACVLGLQTERVSWRTNKELLLAAFSRKKPIYSKKWLV